jgi:hydroxypyruvate reductase
MGRFPAGFAPSAFLHELFAIAVASAQPEHTMALALPPPPVGRTVVLGAGKAAGSMAHALEAIWPGKLEGVVIVPDGYTRAGSTIEQVEASHPVPDARGLAAAQRILAMAQGAGADDLVLCLISGGASALMVAPATGVDLAEKCALTAALLRSGASINELNCVRKHLSAIKGGRLAVAAAPARVVSLIISDVVGDDPAVIASGPTVADPTTCAEALAVLTRYNIPVPDHIAADLTIGRLETPKHLPETVVRMIARSKDSLAAESAGEGPGFRSPESRRRPGWRSARRSPCPGQSGALDSRRPRTGEGAVRGALGWRGGGDRARSWPRRPQHRICPGFCQRL